MRARRVRLAVAALLAAPLMAAVPALAGPAAPAVRAEIDALLGRLEASGCQFNRNGSWYGGAEARGHLLRKLAYLEDHGTVASTEQFIELAATKSSSSGRAYEVRCANAAAVPSQSWLTQQLAAMRAARRSTP